jgi:hypothetical protein
MKAGSAGPRFRPTAVLSSTSVSPSVRQAPRLSMEYFEIEQLRESPSPCTLRRAGTAAAATAQATRSITAPVLPAGPAA